MQEVIKVILRGENEDSLEVFVGATTLFPTAMQETKEFLVQQSCNNHVFYFDIARPFEQIKHVLLASKVEDLKPPYVVKHIWVINSVEAKIEEKPPEVYLVKVYCNGLVHTSFVSKNIFDWIGQLQDLSLARPTYYSKPNSYFVKLSRSVVIDALDKFAVGADVVLSLGTISLTID